MPLVFSSHLYKRSHFIPGQLLGKNYVILDLYVKEIKLVIIPFTISLPLFWMSNHVRLKRKQNLSLNSGPNAQFNCHFQKTAVTE